MNLDITIRPNLTTIVTLPPSKSIANRKLLLASLAHQPLKPIATHRLCNDIMSMLNGLQATSGDIIDVDGAGTALRFLAAYWAAREGACVTLTGNQRLRQRPIEPLIEALQNLGADITCLGEVGAAPLLIHGRRLQGKHITMRGDISSQFASALLMIGPIIGGIQLELTGDIMSRPYIDMTIELMKQHGVTVDWQDNTLIVPQGDYMPAPIDIEGDWSAATFWLALQALLPQSHIALRGLSPDSMQGDRRILAIMQQMGMTAQWLEDGTLITDMGHADCCCCSTYADLSGTPDLAPVLVVALCLMGRPFRITGLRTLRHKESNRSEVLRHELAKLGYAITLEGDDAVSWHFATCPGMTHPVIDPHDDHRMAMAFALAAVKHPCLTLLDAHVVDKSYPGFWNDLCLL